MNLFNRITPVYKTAASFATTAKAVTSSGLSGLLGSLFGSATPTYKTVDGGCANAPASSSGIFASLLGSVAPSYKTAPAPMATAELLDEATVDAIAGDGDAASMAGEPASVEVVLL